MPPLVRLHHSHTVTLPPRPAAVVAEPDVLVVGGGPAGLGAALGAAGVGAEVLLAERYGFLGGNATAALVMPLMSSHTQRGQPRPAALNRLLPPDHGPGEPVVAGAFKALGNPDDDGYGWILGHSAVIHPDPVERTWARKELEWWVPRARHALETWSPPYHLL